MRNISDSCFWVFFEIVQCESAIQAAGVLNLKPIRKEHDPYRRILRVHTVISMDERIEQNLTNRFHRILPRAPAGLGHFTEIFVILLKLFRVYSNF